MSKELNIQILEDNAEKQFEVENAYDMLYTDSFLKFDAEERIYSCYCKKCNIKKKDLLLKDLVDFIDSHEELFSINQIFYFFKCKKDI